MGVVFWNWCCEELQLQDYLRILTAVSTHIKQHGKRRGAFVINIPAMSLEALQVVDFLIDYGRPLWCTINLYGFSQLLEANEYVTILKEEQPHVTLHVPTFLERIAESILVSYKPSLVFDNAPVAPCGEAALESEDDAMIEIALNLPNFVRRNDFDFKKLRSAAASALKFASNLTKEVRENVKIGLGVMGFADLCVLLGVRYESEDSVLLLKQICKELKSFKQHNVRFAQAPTGTRAIIGACSPSIFTYFDKHTVSRLTDEQKEEAAKAGLIKFYGHIDNEFMLELFKVMEEELGARVSGSLVVGKTINEVLEWIKKAHTKGVKQVSLFPESGQTAIMMSMSTKVHVVGPPLQALWRAL